MKGRFVAVAGGAAMGTVLLLSGCGGAGTEGTIGNIRLTAAEALLQSSQKAGRADSFKADLTVTEAGERAVPAAAHAGLHREAERVRSRRAAGPGRRRPGHLHR
jgi:hypothetical protein